MAFMKVFSSRVLEDDYDQKKMCFYWFEPGLELIRVSRRSQFVGLHFSSSLKIIDDNRLYVSLLLSKDEGVPQGSIRLFTLSFIVGQTRLRCQGN